MRIPESSVLLHLRSATFTLSHLVKHTLGGRSIYSNQGVRYTGSDDDVDLNRRVLRYTHDAAALAEFSQQADFRGRLTVPTLSLHSRQDSTVFVEQQHSLLQQATAGKFEKLLAQAYTTHADHSYMADEVYGAAITALLRWADGGPKPTPVSLQNLCRSMSRPEGQDACRFDLDFRPSPLDARVAPRVRH
jgi:pimeloyl-ACP methyl ester carboxylesterase